MSEQTTPTPAEEPINQQEVTPPAETDETQVVSHTETTEVKTEDEPAGTEPGE